MSNVASRVHASIRVFGLIGMVGLVAFAGCDSGVGPLTSVQGKVTVDGKPLTAGLVTFLPTDPAAKGNILGRVGPDGTYTMATNGHPGVPKGKYKVTVAATASPTNGSSDPSKMASNPAPAAPPKRLANAKYESATTTDLSMEVPSASYDLNLTR